MFYDLKGDPGLSPIVGMLYAAVRENHARLRTITDGMSQDEVDYRGPNERYNSTAQLIKHLTFVDLNWVYRMKGEPLPEALRDGYGPMMDKNNRLPMVNGVPWETLMSRYDRVLAMLREACASLSDAGLEKVVTFGHHNEKKATLRWGLWHIADHSRYHQAQINQLRRWYREFFSQESHSS